MKKPSLHQETLHQETLHQETLHQEILHQETLHQETLHQETLHQETLHQEILHQETLFQEIFTSRNLNCVHNPQQTKPHMKKMFLSQTLGREVFIQCECRARSAARKDCQEAQDTREEELHQEVDQRECRGRSVARCPRGAITSACTTGGVPRGVRGGVHQHQPTRAPQEECREVRRSFLHFLQILSSSCQNITGERGGSLSEYKIISSQVPEDSTNRPYFPCILL